MGIRLSPDGRRVYSGGITGDHITVAEATTFEILKRFAARLLAFRSILPDDI